MLSTLLLACSFPGRDLLFSTHGGHPFVNGPFVSEAILSYVPNDEDCRNFKIMGQGNKYEKGRCCSDTSGSEIAEGNSCRTHPELFCVPSHCDCSETCDGISRGFCRDFKIIGKGNVYEEGICCEPEGGTCTGHPDLYCVPFHCRGCPETCDDISRDWVPPCANCHYVRSGPP